MRLLTLCQPLGTVEHFTLDFEWTDRSHPVFGQYKDRIKRTEDGNIYYEAVSDKYAWKTGGTWKLVDEGQTMVRDYEFEGRGLKKTLRLVYRKQK